MPITRRQVIAIGGGALASLAMPRLVRARSTKTVYAVMHAPLRATDLC